MEQSYIRVMVGAMDRADRVIAVEWSANLPLQDYEDLPPKSAQNRHVPEPLEDFRAQRAIL